MHAREDTNSNRFLSRAHFHFVGGIMRAFVFQDQDGEHTVTEEGILRTYYPYWCGEMTKVGKFEEISIESCIEDFTVVNWAEEVTNEG